MGGREVNVFVMVERCSSWMSVQSGVKYGVQV